MDNQILPKWLINTLGALLVVLVAILILQKGNDFKNAIKSQKPANTISVSGEGQLTATPDLATVDVGVMTQGTTAQDVKDQNNTKINKVIDFIKSQGIEAKDIKTSQLSLYPQQSYPVYLPGSGTQTIPKITGYQGNQTVTVAVHGVDKSQDVLSKILDGSVNAGANQINGVSFSFEKTTLTSLQQQARQQAIDDAKQKAQGLADKAGLNLGKIVSIAESSGGYPGPMPYALSAPSVAMGGGAADSKSIAPNVEPGSQDITESMSVTFEVK